MFTEPCDNCAFRPGSKEQKNKKEWKEMIVKLKSNRGAFFCHKGVPINVKNEHGFDYPIHKDGEFNKKKMRICRGYMNMMFAKTLKKVK